MPLQSTLQSPTVIILHPDEVVTKLTARLLKNAQIATLTLSTPESLIDLLPLKTPGCLLIELNQLTVSGIQLAAELRKRACYHPILFTSTLESPIPLNKAMESGAAGFIKRPFEPLELIERVQQQLRLHQQRWPLLYQSMQFRHHLQSLSPREQEVLEILLHGYSAKRTGEILALSARTVEHHRVKIVQKFRLDSFQQLVKQASVAEAVVTLLGNEMDFTHSDLSTISGR